MDQAGVANATISTRERCALDPKRQPREKGSIPHRDAPIFTYENP
jgi:hypothetical protein